MRKEITLNCSTCGRRFKARSENASTCSSKCRQKRYRKNYTKRHFMLRTQHGRSATAMVRELNERVPAKKGGRHE